MFPVFCECGDLLFNKRQYISLCTVFFYCDRCKKYYDSKGNGSYTLPCIFHDTAVKKFGRGIYYLYDYHHKRNRPESDKISEKLIDLKKREPTTLSNFSEYLKQAIKSEFNITICVVPSHEEGLHPSGVRDIAKRIISNNIIDGTDCLRRRCTVLCSHNTQGPRPSWDEMYASLMVQSEDQIKNKIVLLIDDITTTGNSLLAGKKKLEQASAKEVVCFAFGQTVRED